MADRSASKELVDKYTAAITSLPNLDVQYVWFEVARQRAWQSLALVPIEAELTTLHLAEGMGKMAAQEPGANALVVNASIADSKAPDGVDEPHHADELWSAMSGSGGDTPHPYELIDFAQMDPVQAVRALAFAPKLVEYLAEEEGRRYSTIVFATDSVLYQTRSIPLIRAVDKVILCLTLGVSTTDDVQRAAEIIGPDRVAGSIAVRPKE